MIVILLFSISTVGYSQLVTPTFQTGHYTTVNQLDFHPNNQLLVSCGDDGKLIVWDIILGLERNEVLAHKEGVKSFHFFNDSTLLTFSHKAELKKWRFPSLDLIQTRQLSMDSIQSVDVINDSTLCAVGNGIYLYNINSNTAVSLNHESKGLFSSVSYQKGRNEIAVTGPSDNYCSLISLDTPEQFKGHFIGHFYKAKYQTSNLLLLTSTDGSVTRVDLKNDKRQFFAQNDNINFISDADEHNNHLSVSSTFGFATIYNPTTNTIEKSVGLNGVALTAIDYSDDGNWLATANANGTICLYEGENYRLNRVLKGISANITAVFFQHEHLYIGYSDGIIRQIHLPTNKIKSNSLQLDIAQQKKGFNYSILSIDQVDTEKVQLTILRSQRHHQHINVLRSAEKLKGFWYLNTNEIVLSKKWDDLSLKLKVDRHFHQKIPFQIQNYQETTDMLVLDNATYKIDNENYNFCVIRQSDTLVYPSKHTANISGLRYLKAYQLILSYSDDGSLRFWDMKGEYLAALYLSGQYGYTYWSKNGFYFTTKEILNKIGFIYSNQLYSHEQYDLYYNRPHEVMKKLQFFSNEEKENYQKAYKKRLEKLRIERNELVISQSLPLLSVNYNGEYSVKTDQISIEIQLEDTLNLITSYQCSVNGIGNSIQLNAPTHQQNIPLSIDLAEGLNQIELSCTNNKGIKSLIKKINVTSEKNNELPSLYLVAIGVGNYRNKSQNLTYPRKDAEEVIKTLKSSKKYKNIYVKPLLDEAFTSNAQSNIATFLSEAKINDVVVLFYAGHGVLDDDFNYYLSTHEMDFNQPEKTGIPFDQLEETFENLTCRNRLMLIDACFSGELDKTTVAKDSVYDQTEKDIQFRGLTTIADNGDMGIFELSKRTFIDLKRNRGTNILSSSSGVEYSLEGDKWGNGLFTYVLKEGLTDLKADLNGDEQVRIMELQVYLREKVSFLSEGKQNPILRKENTKNNFVIW